MLCGCPGWSAVQVRVGDRVRVELGNAPEYFDVVSEDADGVEKHRVEGDFVFVPSIFC